MKENIQFYKMQFEMFNMTENMMKAQFEYSQEKIDEVIELIGRKPTHALELGSGMGLDAAAMYKKDVHVDALEIVPELIEYAKQVQETLKTQVNLIQGDFFKYTPDKLYDLVYYMDGFGVSSHDDQVKLLQNIESWLSDQGDCVIEIYSPSHWKKAENVEMQLSDTVSRKYTYDYSIDAFLDTWTADDGFSYTQTLYCYTPDQIKEMVKKTNMKIVSFTPGGKMDYETMTYHEKASLEDCMMYKVVLKKEA